MRRVVAAFTLSVVALVAGCAGGSQAYLPVDSPLRPWAAPEGMEAPAPATVPAADKAK